MYTTRGKKRRGTRPASLFLFPTDVRVSILGFQLIRLLDRTNWGRFLSSRAIPCGEEGVICTC